ncbi:hypothetical protein E2C01_050975 [Portunus trituberculatus]|uniref:Uncharacterized protein n=1 Tax=Portunus trituberculatus TaxID=210409 RepID=A0A5B7GIB8_PORTR|nr:hypothetical protein [Portunus trituberculatus]
MYDDSHFLRQWQRASGLQHRSRPPPSPLLLTPPFHPLSVACKGRFSFDTLTERFHKAAPVPLGGAA